MSTLSAARLLDFWERGRTQSPSIRALLLVIAATGVDSGALEDWSVGKCDSVLLTLREELFGPRVAGLTDCPQCGSRLEMDFAVDDIRAPFAEDREVELAVETEAGDYQVKFHPVRLHDLAEISARPSAEALLARCVTAVHQSGKPQDAGSLPPIVVERIIGQLAELDPQADVALALACADCGHQWHAVFDIGAFLWQELDRWAHQKLGEVHILATAYGWSEHDILALSDSRRNSYLKMIMT